MLMPWLVSYSSRCSAQSKKSGWAYAFILNHHRTGVGQHRSQKQQSHPSFAILFPASLPGSHELERKPDSCFKFSFKPHQYLAPQFTGRPQKHLEQQQEEKEAQWAGERFLWQCCEPTVMTSTTL